MEKVGKSTNIITIHMDKSSVEWLESEFIKLESTIGVHGIMYELIEKAKKMEKEKTITFAQDYLIDFNGSLLKSLHQDLLGFKKMEFLTPDAKIGLGIAIEQVERYMRGELEVILNQ